ncbi:MAG: hypothetical protein AAFV51_11935 [Pseudomonadota bacterium]
MRLLKRGGLAAIAGLALVPAALAFSATPATASGPYGHGYYKHRFHGHYGRHYRHRPNTVVVNRYRGDGLAVAAGLIAGAVLLDNVLDNRAAARRPNYVDYGYGYAPTAYPAAYRYPASYGYQRPMTTQTTTVYVAPQYVQGAPAGYQPPPAPQQYVDPQALQSQPTQQTYYERPPNGLPAPGDAYPPAEPAQPYFENNAPVQPQPTAAPGSYERAYTDCAVRARSVAAQQGAASSFVSDVTNVAQLPDGAYEITGFLATDTINGSFARRFICVTDASGVRTLSVE